LSRSGLCLLLALTVGVPASAEDDNLVFKSDVSLVRVDAQVVDRNNRAITGLQREDFVLIEDGKRQEIRNFESEDMPMDLVLLLDVSGSMQSHIERLSEASHQALQVLGPDDRVAVMVFDRGARIRLPFKNGVESVERELENVLRHETFDGGTDINRGLLEAASYIGREGRRDARRAIVILTDDQTERQRDEATVLRAVTRADAVVSALIAPDALNGRYGGGGVHRGGGGWPSAGGGMGGPLGGIIFGRRGPYGYPGGGGGGGGPVIVQRSRTQSAGTAEIARQSGGDSMRVDEAAALETTLMRLRQRYTLHFNLPEGVQPGQERGIEVQLADAARRRYAGSEVRYRRVYVKQDGSGADPVMVSRTPASARRPADSDDASAPTTTTRPRRPAVNEDGSRIGGWRRADDPAVQPDTTVQQESTPSLSPAPPAKPADPEPKPTGGWRRVKPGEQPQ
jgi:VWFA-related protein